MEESIALAYIFDTVHNSKKSLVQNKVEAFILITRVYTMKMDQENRQNMG